MVADWLPEGNEVLEHNFICVHSSDARRNGAKDTVLFSFLLSFSVALTLAVLLEMLPVLHLRTFFSYGVASTLLNGVQFWDDLCSR